MSVEEELNTISEQHNGLLRPIDVVEFAKSKDTALHNCFEWDDSIASHQYRLWQARQVIRVRVIMPKREDPVVVRAWLSLPSDRVQLGGGYRPLMDVLSDAGKKAELFRQVRQDIRILQNKYKALKELDKGFAALHDAIDEAIGTPVADA